MKKLIVLILVLSMTILSLFSCAGGTKEENNDSEKDNTPTPTTEEPVTEIERPAIDKTDLGGYTFRVLRPNDYLDAKQNDEVYAEAENGDTMNDAIYKRNKIAEDYLNIKIKSITATNTFTTELANYAKKSIMAGGDDFDAICGANWTPISLVQSNCLENLYTVPNINLTKPWWDQRAVAEMSYEKEKLYYACGDINYYDDYGIMVVYFNKRLFGENMIEYPYELVRQGKWTIDELEKIVKGYTSDLNGDGKLDENDKWGICENSGAVYHFLIGCGETISYLDSEGIPQLKGINERHINIVEKLGSLFSDKNSVLIADSGQLKHIKDPYFDGIFKIFRNGQALMMAEMIGTIPTFRDMEDDFGLLPLPKYDVSQPEYHSFTSYGWASSYSIPKTNTDLGRTGMILEIMAGYSRDTITPAVIDVSLKSKFSRDEESAEMLQLIINTRTYDLALDYGWGGLGQLYNNVTLQGAGKFTSSVEKSLDKAKLDQEKTIKAFEDGPSK